MQQIVTWQQVIRNAKKMIFNRGKIENKMAKTIYTEYNVSVSLIH